MQRALFAVVLSMLLAACTATGPKFTDAPTADGKARVYIYRVHQGWAYKGADSSFYIDGKNAIDLQTGGYSYVYLSPGRHDISQKWPAYIDPFSAMRTVSMEVQAGETHYVRFSVTAPSLLGTTSAADANWDLREASPAEAGKEISQMVFQSQNPKTGYNF